MNHPKAYRQGVGILVFICSPNMQGRLWVLPSAVFNPLTPNDLYRVSQEEWTKLREGVP